MRCLRHESLRIDDTCHTIVQIHDNDEQTRTTSMQAGLEVKHWHHQHACILYRSPWHIRDSASVLYDSCRQTLLKRMPDLTGTITGIEPLDWQMP